MLLVLMMLILSLWLAENNGYETVAVTFDVSQILNRSKKLEMLEAEGIDTIILLPFSDEILSIEGIDFLRDFLVERLQMKAIVAGPDCAFGHRKSGDISLLKQHAEEYGYTVHVIDKVRNEEGEEINSTMIRNLIGSGQLEKAKSYLGDSGKYL